MSDVLAWQNEILSVTHENNTPDDTGIPSSSSSGSSAPSMVKRRRLNTSTGKSGKHLSLQGFEETPCKVIPMDSVSLQNLSVRLGAPYVFCHGNGCEHVISFTDLRVEKSAKYPRETFRRPMVRKDCDVCGKREKAQYVVYGHPQAGKDPTYFCESCYTGFLYDENGKLIFKNCQVYPYFHEL